MKYCKSQVVRYFFVLAILFASACSDSEQDQIDLLAYNLWEYSINNPDGFTVEIPNITEVTRGFSVGYLVEFNNTGKESLKDVINHALKHDNTVGGWLYVEDNTYYFDSVKIFSETEQAEAEQFAIDNQQKAYYDLTNGVTIFIDD